MKIYDLLNIVMGDKTTTQPPTSDDHGEIEEQDENKP